MSRPCKGPLVVVVVVVVVAAVASLNEPVASRDNTSALAESRSVELSALVDESRALTNQSIDLLRSSFD